MLVRAIAGVNDAGSETLREKLRSTGRTMAEHDDIGVVRFQNFGRVLERFTFGQARRTRRDVNDVRAQADRGDLERRAGARARFDKEIDQGFAAERRHLLDLTRADFLERVRGIENESDLTGGELANAEQIFPLPADLGFCRLRHPFSSLISQTASGSPSTFSSRRRTRSPGAVGRFLPT